MTDRTERLLDASQMYVGPMPALRRCLLADRRSSASPHFLIRRACWTNWGRYFCLYQMRTWRAVLDTVGLDIGGSYRQWALSTTWEVKKAVRRYFWRVEHGEELGGIR